MLENYPETRGNDYLLWLSVIEAVNNASLVNINLETLGFAFVLRNINYLGLPNYETVSRVRRKLQEKFPELRTADGTTIQGRKDRERAFRDYARERFV